jgi:hypothetical protein
MKTISFKSIAFIKLIVAAMLVFATAPDSTLAKAQTSERGMRAQVGQLPIRSKRWALIIGVDQYKDKQIGLLNGAANDAKTLAEALIKNAGFPADQVILLASDQPEERQPTRANILRRLSNLSSIVPKDGLLLVSFAGHGIERGGQAYLLPSDAQLSDDISFLEDTAVSVTRVTDRIRSTGVKQVLLVLDACRNDPSGRADAPNRMSEAFKFNFDARNREIEAFAVLYATAIGERAYEYTEKRQGYFSWAIVDGMRGAAANEKGEVTLASLLKYVQEAVPKRIGIDLGRGKQQRPFAVIEGYKADELVIALPEKKIPPPVASAPPQTVDPMVVEIELWRSVDKTDENQLRAYLRKYPNGQFADVANLQIEKLKKNRTAEQPSSSSSQLDRSKISPAVKENIPPAGKPASVPKPNASDGAINTPPKTNPKPVELSKPVESSKPASEPAVESAPNSSFVLSEDEMRKFEGKYETENQKLKLNVYIVRGKLLLATSDQSAVVLVPIGQTRFRVEQGDKAPAIVVHFEMNKSLLKQKNNQRVERMIIEKSENEKIVLLPKKPS